MDAPCIHCGKKVGNHHQAIDCDRCGGWQHRGCGDTGLTKYMYTRLKKGDIRHPFTCGPCTDQNTDEVPMDVSSILSETTNAHDTIRMPTLLSSTRTSINDDLRDTTTTTIADTTIAEDDNETNDSSFNLSMTIEQPDVLHESSIRDVDPSDTVVEDQQLAFNVISGGTAKGKDMLVDTDGYAYNVKCARAKSRTWWCSVRNKKMRCPATVLERSGEFRRGVHTHSHPAEAGIAHKIKLTKQVKDIAASHVFRPAMKIVEQQFQQELNKDDFAIPDPDLLVRRANRHRQKARPDDPHGYDFELAEQYLPAGFLREDIVVDGGRHIIFATSTQLETLQQAKTWYLDVTFKILRSNEPFEQLFSIHAFLKKDDATKQVPLVFVFMSRRRKRDYKEVLKKVKSLFDGEPSVQAFVLDFEAATWAAIRSVFPAITIRGFAFHWSQAVFRKVQAIGLQGEYTAKGPCHTFVRQLLALPLLPAEHIRPAFERLSDRASEHLQPLMGYVSTTWIEGSWTPEVWSVYGQPIRTNNDCEGWHRRLNHRSGGPPPFYLLVNSLHEEAALLPLQARLVSCRR